MVIGAAQEPTSLADVVAPLKDSALLPEDKVLLAAKIGEIFGQVHSFSSELESRRVSGVASLARLDPVVSGQKLAQGKLQEIFSAHGVEPEIAADISARMKDAIESTLTQNRAAALGRF